MLAAFFDTSRVDTLAADVVREVLRFMPPGEVHNDSKAAVRKREQLTHWLAQRVRELHRGPPLNFYQKAKLGTCLQDRLEAAGYAAEFSKTFSYDVVHLVAQSAVA